jgi:hypothetical protein
MAEVAARSAHAKGRRLRRRPFSVDAAAVVRRKWSAVTAQTSRLRPERTNLASIVEAPPRLRVWHVARQAACGSTA